MKNTVRTPLGRIAALLRWIALACAVGLPVGAVSVAFHYGIEWATRLRTEHTWLLFLLPAGGVAITLLYRASGMERDRGTNFVLVAVRENERMRLRTAPLIFVSTIITHLFGGSVGREGAALQLGGSIASYLGHKAKFDPPLARITVVCGMSAAFSALFGTPLAAAVFAMEVVHIGVIHYSALVPAMLSSLVGFEVALWLGVEPTSFVVLGVPTLSPLSILQIVAMGGGLAVLSVVFCQVLHGAQHLYQKYLPNPFLRAAAGGALVIALTVLVGTYDYNGAGMHVVRAAVEGTVRPEAFLLKILFTALTLGAGFKGGEVVPVLFTGATFGCLAGPLLGLHPSFSAALGMVGLFCGVTNCPFASLLLSFELFGGTGMLFFALCCAVSYMLSGYGGLYSEQRIMFSKLKPEERCFD